MSKKGKGKTPIGKKGKSKARATIKKASATTTKAGVTTGKPFATPPQPAGGSLGAGISS